MARGSTSAEDDRPAAGQFTTPWKAGMKASVRSLAGRRLPRYGVA